MSTRLKAQLENYTDEVLTRQQPITAGEVRSRIGAVRELPTPASDVQGSPIRLATGVAAALLIVVVAVAAAYLQSGDDAAAERVDPTVSEGDRIVTEGLERIDEYVLEMELVGETPSPRFDAGLMGSEVELFRIAPDMLGDYSEPVGFWSLEPGEEVTRRWTAAVTLEEPTAPTSLLDSSTARGVFIVESKFDGEHATVSLFVDLTAPTVSGDPIGLGSGFDDVPRPPGLVVVVQDDGNNVLNSAYIAIGGLPAEASVVATTLADGTQVWQRPIDGMALFADVLDHGTYRVLDADGSQILTIESHTSGFFDVVRH